MKLERRVALLIETSGAYGREVLRGVAQFSRLHGPWSFFLTPTGHDQRLPDLRLWEATGVIARIETMAMAQSITASGLPTIGLDLTEPIKATLQKSVWVSELHPDPEAVGRLAGEHLYERGFRSLAFVGLRNWTFSEARQKAFAGFAESLGLSCPAFNLHNVARVYKYGADQKRLTAWLNQQARPLGLLCCNDDCAREVLDTALTVGIRIPDEVAVLGVDNDSVLCDLCNPPLSSVMPNAFHAGFRAAELLDKVMAGKQCREEIILVPSAGVQTRQSTDVVAVNDKRISAAVRFIRENACKNISVKDLLRSVPMSRTILDARFKKLLGCTPHENIQHVKIERVKILLTTTDLTLSEVAEQTGFDHVEYLSVAFKRATGVAPGAYRQQRNRGLAG